MVRVRRCVLVAASASRLVPLSVTVNYRSLRPNSTTLKPNRIQGRRMTRTRIQNLYRIEKRRMHLMTWQKRHSARAHLSSAKLRLLRRGSRVWNTEKRVGGVTNEKITQTYRFVRFVARSVFSFSFSLCFSFASRIRFAVPLLSPSPISPMRKKQPSIV